MRSRHRIPTIFNLYMVDVLCCSLGCAIMLWLLNLHDAKELGEKAGKTRILLTETQVQLDQMTRRAERTDKDLVSARSRISDLDQLLADLQGKYAAVDERLTKKTKEQQLTAKSLEMEKKQVASLQLLLREKETLAKTAARAADDLTERLHDADALNKKLADMIPGMKEDLDKARVKQSAADELALMLRRELDDRKKAAVEVSQGMRSLEDTRRSLQRELDFRTLQLVEANRGLDLLKGERKTLADQISRAKTAIDHRFAGITLTGRNVVFLVDMSGSMEMVDEQTTAPDKWSGVRDTLIKIMRSLPQLDRYQVILFSEKTNHPLGQEDRWLEYDPIASPERVARALAAVKPKGNTNMYAAFESAFRYRANGLDTIYLLSDGLPNVGTGLTPEAARSMKETEKSEILGQFVRKTLKTDWNGAQAAKTRVRINTIGFFYESPDVGAFLWALAREHEGSFVGMSKP